MNDDSIVITRTPWALILLLTAFLTLAMVCRGLMDKCAKLQQDCDGFKWQLRLHKRTVGPTHRVVEVPAEDIWVEGVRNDWGAERVEPFPGDGFRIPQRGLAVDPAKAKNPPWEDE